MAQSVIYSVNCTLFNKKWKHNFIFNIVSVSPAPHVYSLLVLDLLQETSLLYFIFTK